ncbi:MAG: sigma-E factor negative regulatory protein [Gammaproteobacteria bacterium]|nr:sigma-E factor negative regulatory protein [Gammaproteobacteria bacterium]
MNEKILEQMSALADGELPDNEAELLLARIAREPALQHAWASFHLAGEALRGGLAARHDAGFHARVMAEVADIQLQPARVSRWRRLAQPLAGVAVAASVALAAVVMLQPADIEAPAEVVPTGAGNPASVPMLGAQQVDFTGVQSPEVQNKLRGYLLNHNEHTSTAPIRGLMPYVQIAARDTQPAGEGASIDDRSDSPEDDKAEAGTE